MAVNGPKLNGNGDIQTKTDEVRQLTAREKKLLSVSSERNALAEPQILWNSTPSDLLGLKQSINFESSNSVSTLINFCESWCFFMGEFPMRESEGEIQRRSVNPITKLQSFIRQPPLLPVLIPQKELIQSVASCAMNNDYLVHRRILQSIYVFLTKNPVCPRYGTHWEEVGFQGQDPASDLRGVGMLGALQMLYLSSAQETKDTLAPEVYELSRHPVHQFPLAVLSLNVTRMALDAFRDGILNRYCNKKVDCISVVNRFYLAIMYRIYRKWKDKGMTIHDSCFLLKAVEKWCRAHPQKTFGKLNAYLLQHGISNGHTVTKSNKNSKKSDKLIESATHSISWLDLTKPSLEVFI